MDKVSLLKRCKIIITIFAFLNCVNVAISIEGDSFSFVVIGDFQYTGNTDAPKDSWQEAYSWILPKVLDEISSLCPKPKLLISPGDFVDGYSGHTMECSPERYDHQYENFLKDIKRLDPEIKYVPIVGNHDYHRYKDPNDSNKITQSGPEKYAQYIIPMVPNNAQPKNSPYYSFDYQDTHFTILCTGLLGVKGVNDYNDLVNGKQYKWLVSDLQKASENPKIENILVFGHHNFYPMKGREGYDRLLVIQQKIWKDLFVRYGVSAYIHGHWHVYERSVHESIPMLCFGGGSALERTIDRKGEFNHYALITVNKKSIIVTINRLFKDKKSEVYESFTIPLEESMDVLN